MLPVITSNKARWKGFSKRKYHQKFTVLYVIHQEGNVYLAALWREFAVNKARSFHSLRFSKVADGSSCF